ncbi:MAG: chorismate mutase [Anaerolineae bacterium]|nr:chorismate mutase [Anaerolineae bacterium]
MPCRGIRGAITVGHNNREAILNAARTLLETIVEKNALSETNIERDLVSVIFTATADLDTAYPAVAARDMGWTHAPLLCMQEQAVVGSLRKCIRVLIQWNTEREQSDMRHIYLGGARALRPDLVEEA